MTSVAFVVGKGKTELSRRVVEVDDGTDADVTFTMTPDVAAAVDAGTLDVSVGFMRGSIKMAGDFGALLRVLREVRSGPGSAATP